MLRCFIVAALAVMLSLTSLADQHAADSVPKVGDIDTAHGPSYDELLNLLNSKQWMYETGDWFKLSPYFGAGESSNLQDSICRLVSTAMNIDAVPHWCAIIDSLVSPFLNSKYYYFALKYGVGDMPSMCGTFQLSASEESPVAMFLAGTDFCHACIIDLSIDGKLAIVTPDIVRAIESEIDTIVCAIDLVTLLSARQPIVIIRDLNEAYQFAQALNSDWLWPIAETNDSVSHLLSRVRLIEPGDNEYLSNPWLEDMMIDLDSLPEASLIHPPAIVARSDSKTTVELFSWTPSGGRLQQWKLHFYRDGELSVERELLMKKFGFCFNYW